MPLELLVEKLDEVDENLKGFFSEKDGKFSFDFSKVEDVTGLKNKNSELLGKIKTSTESIAAKDLEIENLKLEAAKKAGSQEDIKKYEDKIEQLKSDIEKAKADSEAEVKKMSEEIGKVVAGGAATKLAAKLSRTFKDTNGKEHNTAAAIEALIRNDFGTELVAGKHRLVIFNEKGEPTADTIEEYEKRIINNPMLLPLIAGTKASGAADHGSGGGGSNPALDLMKLPPAERMKAARAAAGK